MQSRRNLVGFIGKGTLDYFRVYFPQINKSFPPVCRRQANLQIPI